jgi:hypothetical protein
LRRIILYSIWQLRLLIFLWVWWASWDIGKAINGPVISFIMQYHASVWYQTTFSQLQWLNNANERKIVKKELGRV